MVNPEPTDGKSAPSTIVKPADQDENDERVDKAAEYAEMGAKGLDKAVEAAKQKAEAGGLPQFCAPFKPAVVGFLTAADAALDKCVASMPWLKEQTKEQLKKMQEDETGTATGRAIPTCDRPSESYIMRRKSTSVPDVWN